MRNVQSGIVHCLTYTDCISDSPELYNWIRDYLMSLDPNTRGTLKVI